MGTLYVVATPIGNLEDITARALRVLREVGLVAAEDTRTARKLFTAYDIHTPLISYFEHNKIQRLDYILSRLEEVDVAIISEAGTPGISDPGYELIRAAIERGIRVVPVPGPSAVIAALSVAGLPTDQFLYLGFPPRQAGERRRWLENVATEPRTLVLFEAPHRLRQSLEDMRAILGDRRLAICRELTKMHEEVFRGTVSEALEHFTEPRGEFTLVVQGAPAIKQRPTEDDVREALRRLRAQGFHAREAVEQVAREMGWPRREVYKLWLELGPITP